MRALRTWIPALKEHKLNERIKKNQAIEPLVTRIVTLNYFTGRFGETGAAGSAGAHTGLGSSGGISGDDLQQLKESLEKQSGAGAARGQGGTLMEEGS